MTNSVGQVSFSLASARGPSNRATGSRRDRWVLAAALLLATGSASAIGTWLHGPFYRAWYAYQPQEGDLVFQSLPWGEVTRAIEGATESPYSHCGIVAQEQGRWAVYEAYGDVAAVPLREFLERGRERAFAVYRLRQAHREHIPALLEEVRKQVGKPYDDHYELSEERLYCSELIFHAYRRATGGETLGRLVPLGELQWQPFVKTIERLAGGPPPLSRKMITPVGLARATQLEPVTAFRMPWVGVEGEPVVGETAVSQDSP